MGGSSTPVSQTTRIDRSPEQIELQRLAMPQLREFAANPPDYYPGNAVAGFDPSQVQGQEAVLGAAPDQASVVGSAADASRFFTSGDVLDVNRNPGLAGHIAAATRPIYTNLTERVLPAVRSGAQQAGQFGGSRQALVEAAAARDAATAAGDTTSKIVSGAYGQGLDAMAKGLGLAPQTAQALTLPGTTTSAVGDVRQDMSQQLINQDVSRFNYGQMLPLSVGETLARISGAMGPAGATTTASTAQGNPLMQGVGGAATGAALGAALLPGVGAIPGAAIGGLLPFLSR